MLSVSHKVSESSVCDIFMENIYTLSWDCPFPLQRLLSFTQNFENPLRFLLVDQRKTVPNIQTLIENDLVGEWLLSDYPGSFRGLALC